MAMYVMVAAAAMQAIGSISRGQQQEAQYQAQAQANEYNAAIMRQRSETALSVSNQREEQVRRNAAFTMGKMRAGIAQSGLGMGGSNADIERQSSVMAELDALNVRYEGTLESKNLLSGANLEDSYAAANRRNAKAALSAGYLGAAGSALSGAGSYLGMGGSSGTPTTNPSGNGGGYFGGLRVPRG